MRQGLEEEEEEEEKERGLPVLMTLAAEEDCNGAHASANLFTFLSSLSFLFFFLLVRIRAVFKIEEFYL